MTRRISSALLLVCLGALWSGGFAVVTAAMEIPSFIDPCMHWDAGGNGSATLRPGDRCDHYTASSATKGQEIARLLLVQGGIFLLSVLAVVGVPAKLRWPGYVAGGALIAMTVALVSGTLFLFTVPAAVCFIGSALLVGRTTPPEPL